MPGRKYSAGSGYRYGFNGKEKDNSTGEGNLDFGARVYDGRIGRWLAIDPHTDKYPNTSPYAFSLNSPIHNIDVAGKFIVDANGNVIVCFVDGKSLKPNKKGSQEYSTSGTTTDPVTGTVTTTTVTLRGTWGFILTNKGTPVPVFVVDNSKTIKAKVVEKAKDGTSTTKDIEIPSSGKDNYNCTTNSLICGNNSMVIPSNAINSKILQEEGYVLNKKGETPKKNSIGVYTNSKGVIDHFEIYADDGTVNSKGGNEPDPGQTSPNTKKGFAGVDTYKVYNKNGSNKKTTVIASDAKDSKTNEISLEELKKVIQSLTVVPPVPKKGQ